MATDSAAVKRELASRILARRHLLQFIKRLDASYKDGWVHRDVCRRLERFSRDVAAGTSPRLMLLMPPRHGKSRIASQTFPAWHLGHYPEHEFIAASYNVALSMVFSRKVQATLEDPRYPFDGVKCDPNNKSVEAWGLDGHAGGYIAAGVGGGITGKGAHVLVIDDPIKNAEEADSATNRETLWDWYTSTAYTRLAPGGGILVIQTCWHDDDLAGRLQQVMQAADPDDPDVDRFEIVKYPAVAEDDEWMDKVTEEIVRIASDRSFVREDEGDDVRIAVLRGEAVHRANQQNVSLATHDLLRVKGEPLHAARYDLPKLARIRKTLPNRFWSALYQQNPVPDDGVFFVREQFRRAKLPQKLACNVFIAFDFAITEKQHNDYTVGSVGLQDEDDILHVADVMRFRTNDASFMVNAIITLIRRWRTPNLRLGFENGQIFLAIETLLKREMRKHGLHVPYETLQPVTDKKVRASPLQGRMQQSRLSFAEGVEWFPVVQSEMLRFPSGVHDDIVDSLAWLARLAAKFEPPRKFVPKSEKSWKDKLPKEHRRASGRSHMTA